MKINDCLTLADAKIIASGCENEALRNGWGVNIAIADDAQVARVGISSFPEGLKR